MKNALHLLSYLFILVLFFTACSPVTVLQKPAKSEKYSYDRVLLIAATNDYNLRKMVEKELSFNMRQKGFNIFSSVNVDENKKDLYTKEELIALAQEKNIDAFIVVKLKDMKTRERYSSNRNVNDPYSMNNFFFVTTFTGVFNWTYVPEKTVTVETALFEAKEKTIIYQADAIYKNSSSMEEGAKAFAKKFTKAYNSSGLLKKKE